MIDIEALRGDTTIKGKDGRTIHLSNSEYTQLLEKNEKRFAPMLKVLRKELSDIIGFTEFAPERPKLSDKMIAIHTDMYLKTKGDINRILTNMDEQ